MSRRRFRIGLHPLYDRRFDQRKLKSAVLNPLGSQVNWLVFEMGDEHGLNAVLTDWRAKLAQAEKVVAELDQRFADLKALRANSGRAVPTRRDPQAEVEYLDALAAMDVTGEECDRLETMLAKMTSTRLAAEAAKVLKYGPVGTGKMGAGNVLAVMDGQAIKVNDEGLLFIDDTRSPYHQMLVTDYKKFLVIPWLQSHARRCAVDRASLPPWPDAVPREQGSKK